MEMVDRYVYAVISRLPAAQKADIEKELRGLIEDMLDERVEGGEPSQQDVEAVLTELGRPSELAASYRGYKRYLISPEMFDPYLLVLKVVGISIMVGLTIAFVVRAFVEPVELSSIFAEYVTTIISALVQGFAWVTFTFGLIEYTGHRKELDGLRSKKAWTPADLQPIPPHKLKISISDPIASIIFTVAFLMIFVSSSNWIGIPIRIDGNGAVITIFNIEILQNYIPWIVLAFALVILRDSAKLISRRWTYKLLAAHVVTSIITTAVALMMFTDASIWNPDFLLDVQDRVVAEGSDGYEIIRKIWDNIQKWFVIGVFVAFAIDMITTALTWFRLRASRS